MIETDPALAALAAQNIARNDFAAVRRALSCSMPARLARAFSARGVSAADHVFMNPPFNDETRPSPHAAKRSAHVGSRRLLTRWVQSAARLLRNNGSVTVIWRADGLQSVLEALSINYGSIAILAGAGQLGGAAIRVIVRAVKGGRAPLTLLAPLSLNGGTTVRPPKPKGS
jgi:tRNA1(Val) A37 N6-methylase TrmN6